MGRGWQDRREAKDASKLAPPGMPTSPLPSPPGTSTPGDIDLQVDPLPQSLAQVPQVNPEFSYDPKASRFPVMRNLLPLGQLSRAHGLG